MLGDIRNSTGVPTGTDLFCGKKFSSEVLVVSRPTSMTFPLADGRLSFFLSSAIVVATCRATARLSALAEGTPALFLFTRTVPFIFGWIVQKYVYEPALVNLSL